MGDWGNSDSRNEVHLLEMFLEKVWVPKYMYNYGEWLYFEGFARNTCYQKLYKLVKLGHQTFWSNLVYVTNCIT